MTARNQSGICPIPVVGLGAIFPGRDTNIGYCQDILEGHDAISGAPASRWRQLDYFDGDPKAADKTYSRRGAFITSVSPDPIEFGTPPALVETTDTVQLIAFYVAKQVLADATQISSREIDTENTSVILDVAVSTELIDDGIRAQFEARGIPIIPQDIGTAAVVREALVSPDRHPEIVFAGHPDALPVRAPRAA